MSTTDSKPCCGGQVADAIEASCRWPVLALLVASVKWFALATVLAFVVSMKCHMPAFLADAAWLTYGRLQAAATGVLLYGFGVQASLGVGLWLLVRLGRAPLAFPGGILAGVILWNLGVLAGVIGVLAGEGTGHHGFPFPAVSAWILFAGYLLVAVGGLTTFRQRRVEELHPAQWHLLTALFWLAWIWSTAAVLLTCVPVRGMMQPVVAWWFGSQLQLVFFGLTGLAVVWVLLPEAAGRPLHSRYDAMLAFWLLVFFSGLRGVPQYAAVPAWMPALGTVAGVLSVVAVLAVGLNVHRTLAGGGYRRALGTRTGLLVLVAAVAWVMAMVLGILGSLPSVSRVTDFTYYEVGVQRLFVLGFLGCAVFAAMYEAVPRLLPGLLPSRRLAGFHVGCMVAGVLLQVIPMVAFGVAQGRSMNDHGMAVFMDAVKPGLMALRIGTLGELLVVLGGVALLVNLTAGSVGWARKQAGLLVAAAVAESAGEVRR